MSKQKQSKPDGHGARRKRRHTPKQLVDRPVTFGDNGTAIVVSAEIVGGIPMVNISYPADVAARQPPPIAPAQAPCSTVGDSALQ